MQRRHRGIPRRAVLVRDTPEREGIEPFRHHHHAPRRQGRQCGRHEPMNMKQGHRTERHVVRREGVAASDVPGGNRQVRMRQRHSLRSARAATRVQHQRDIVRRRRDEGLPSRPIGDRHVARRRDRDREDANPITGRAARRFRTVRGNDQHASVGVLEVKPEFVLFVRRIEGRGAPRGRGGEKRHDHRQAVRQRDRDAVASPDSDRGERLGESLHLAAERAVSDPTILFG